MSGRGPAFVAGLLLGAAAGYAWWTREQGRHKEALYSPRPLKRLAALGWVSGRPSADSILLLREYLGWEQNPVLRRRARRLLVRFENALA
ncbi:MAG: hypothetical protein KF689_09110 [Gemmatimonadaceae bacterium]|nr:hypothetical protein [Gemmatimonadaceae bacterium]MCW5826244.1 hypothetical protein [Gemmatimonadaceae bacterium]